MMVNMFSLITFATSASITAQARLGHGDLSAPLQRQSHASTVDDEDITDELDAVLNGKQWVTSRTVVSNCD